MGSSIAGHFHDPNWIAWHPTGHAKFKMTKFIVGTKQEMTQVFTDDGRVHPATIIAVSPLTVTQIKTKDKDGYSAVQFGFGTLKESKVGKAQKGKGGFAHFIEMRTDDPTSVTNTIDASAFAEGDTVEVSGITKAKGFQGAVKRHGFHGGRRTHGQKHSEREVGSIGGGGRAGGRVVKGMRMAGRMGGDRVTVKNLKVLQVDSTNGFLVISGAIPGRRGTQIEVRGK
jgi:large subunit ribosomal protein L3